MEQKAAGRDWTHGRCGEDWASEHGARALPGELPRHHPPANTVLNICWITLYLGTSLCKLLIKTIVTTSALIQRNKKKNIMSWLFLLHELNLFDVCVFREATEPKHISSLSHAALSVLLCAIQTAAAISPWPCCIWIHQVQHYRTQSQMLGFPQRLLELHAELF